MNLTLREYLLEAWRDRSVMPQIKTPHMNRYLGFLSQNGIEAKKEKIHPSCLMPTQKVDDEKVDSMLANNASIDKPVIVDHIYQIIDGHHRWKANFKLGSKMNVVRLLAPWENIYDVTQDFDGVSYEEGYAPRINITEAEEREITKSDLNKIEQYLDAIFKALGIDIEFSKHFLDRVNDERNKKQITLKELIGLFTKQYKENGKKIAQLGPDKEAVLKDLASELNMPIALNWNRSTGMLDMVSKTVMRKKDFFAKDNKVFQVR